MKASADIRLRSSIRVVWDEQTLDRWIADPQKVVPNTYMAFRGIPNKQQRDDLIAFLKAASEGTVSSQAAQMVRGRPRLPDLKALGPDQQVKSLTHCQDTYRVTTEDGDSAPYWEFNLRFKTDSSAHGPKKGHPALLPANMGGDRAFIIFAEPGEISSFIHDGCQ
ncbi:MAG TPA: hypothetical protein VE131_07420 [Terriglobales bacterium]|nr:hypothetical protein [Terriglobales bacterium]